MLAHLNKLPLKSLILLVGLTTNCKKPQPSSDTSFILNNSGGGLIRYINQPEIMICTNDMSRAQDISMVVQTWIGVARGIAKPNVVQQSYVSNCVASVTFEPMSPVSPSYTVTSAGSARVTMNSASQWYNSTPVLMHEFGHAFGLGDTYSPAQSTNGVCMAGQPQQAIMCTISLGQPQADDAQGIQAVQAAAGIAGAGTGAVNNLAQYGTNNNTTPYGSQVPFGNNQMAYGTGQMPYGTGMPYNNYYNPLATTMPMYGNQFGTMTEKQMLPLLIAAVVVAGTKGITLAENNPNPSFSASKCDAQVQTFIAVNKEKPNEKPRIGMVAAFTTANVTACVGALEDCGLPHQPRYLGNRVITDNKEWYVSSPLQDTDKAKLLNREKIAPNALVTVEGLHFPDGINQPPKPFRCISKPTSGT